MANQINTYTVDELAQWIKTRPSGTSFVDVREYNELIEQGVIHGYDQNIPYFLINTNAALFEEQFSQLDKDKQLVISCRSGRRSLLAAEYAVTNLGFKDVYNVEGGILKWIERGYPVEDISSSSDEST